MKKILFVCEGLNSGGVEKAFLEFIKLIDRNIYEVDLYLITKSSVDISDYEEFVKVTYVKTTLLYQNLPLLISLKHFWKRHQLKQMYNRILLAFDARANKKKSIQNLWSRTKSKVKKEVFAGYVIPKYDTVIAFKDGLSVYFAKDILEQDFIAWNHVDYDSLLQSQEFDLRYYNAALRVITVSKYCKKRLENKFKNISIETIYNYLDYENIRRLAKKDINLEKWDDGSFNIVTVGRLVNQKGLDIAIEAIKHLRDKKINIFWHFIGEGKSRAQLRKMVRDMNLEDRVYFHGRISNPYPYILKCDLYVQPSRYEGYGLTVLEARILGKPILVSNLEVFEEQIKNGINGSITDLTGVSLSRKIETLIDHKELLTKYSKANQCYNYRSFNEKSTVRFLSLIQGDNNV